MRARRTVGAIGAVATTVVLLAGCNAGHPGSGAPAAAPSGASAADPLGNVEATISAIEHDVDSDAAAGR